MAQLANIHPGAVLREELLKPLGITAYRLAREIRVPQQRLVPILSGKGGISPEMALRLGTYLHTRAQFWLNLQDAYNIEEAQEKIGSELRQITPLPEPVNHTEYSESSSAESWQHS